MIDLPYSLVIEATADPEYFGFYSTELEGFTGIGQSVEDCICQARSGMTEHVTLLREKGLPVPPPNPGPMITLQNVGGQTSEIVVSGDNWRPIQETLHLSSVPGMKESIVEGLRTPVEECDKELDW